mgnify:CR=1 FL=1
MNYKTLGETLRHFRQIHDVSVKDFYRISGLSEARICNLEGARESISLKTIERYALVLEMNISDFMLEYELRENGQKLGDPVQTINKIHRLTKGWRNKK